MKPVIFGLSGLSLSDLERDLFREVDPAGYILFKRNVEDREQMRALTDSLRDLHGRDDIPIMIDQEGGRVARMQPPVWPVFPAGNSFNALYHASPISAMEAARCNAEAIALMLAEVGVNVNAMPLLDVGFADTHPAIGDRVMGSDPVQVAALGRVVIDGMRAGGVAGIIKHMPGQGRAVVDSHHELPRVSASADELEKDLFPFRTLNTAPIGMTGHVVFTAWDKDRCATMSPKVIGDIIRAKIGFDGLLLSDDLQMSALYGDMPTRAVNCIAAGCDIALHCSARPNEMAAIAQKLPDISAIAKQRLDRAMAAPATKGNSAGIEDLIAKRDALLAVAL